jgi:ribose-phosphate pyrophosphokinase
MKGISVTDHPLRIFSGSAHPDLALEIADVLGVELGKSSSQKLPDSEIHVIIDEVVHGQDIFLIQPCSAPVNDSLIELILYLDAFRRASVHSVSVVMPYFPYARQERMARGREAISARVVANMLETGGADRVIFVDIHNRATRFLQHSYRSTKRHSCLIRILSETSIPEWVNCQS